MDAPLAARCADWFMEGYEKQAKEEKKEAVEIVNAINYDALKAMCARYDIKRGSYPGTEYEGEALLTFFEELKDEVKKSEILKGEENDR